MHDPATDGLIGDGDPSLSEQVLDNFETKCDAQIKRQLW
jgi:hypothetical protein